MSKAIQVCLMVELEVPDDVDRDSAGPHVEELHHMITVGLDSVGLGWDLINTYLATDDPEVDPEELE